MTKVYRTSVLKRWLDRDGTDSTPIKPNMNMRSTAALKGYESMLVKMLRTIPISKRLEKVSKKDTYERTMLHYAATASSASSLTVLKLILTMYPTESECLRAVCTQDEDGNTVLHNAANSANPETIKYILAVLPKSQHLQIVNTRDHRGRTVLHRAARTGNLESLKTILSVYPETDYLAVIGVQDANGWTILHHVAHSGNLESMKVILSLYPESEHFRALNGLSHKRITPFHLAAHSDNIEFIQYILTSLTVSERLETVSIEDSGRWNALRHAARSKNPESIKCIIILLTESFHTQSVYATQNRRSCVACHGRAEHSWIECLHFHFVARVTNQTNC